VTDSTPRVALVTGGTRGIGRAVVEALLGRGERVWFTGRSAETVEAAARELGERFPPPLAVGRLGHEEPAGAHLQSQEVAPAAR
jgi:NAD(P)-dependent dehydrogenase (short-subunit alcohol dehydrogenase family)